MKSDLVNNFRELLDSMSQEQFDMEWAEITALNLEGPTFSDFVEYISVSQVSAGNYEVATEVLSSTFSSGVNNYAAAA